jgi:hypothetical protein
MATPGGTGLLNGTLSFTADGSELGFIMFRIADTVGPVRAAGTMWLLPADSAAGSATARARKVTTGPRDSAPFSTVLSGDGRTMYVLSTPAPVPDSGHISSEPVTLSAYSTADGALIRTVHTWTGVPTGLAIEPGMTISRGGGQLLIWGVGGTAAYRVDPVSGAVKPAWLYSLQDKGQAIYDSSIAWQGRGSRSPSSPNPASPAARPGTHASEGTPAHRQAPRAPADQAEQRTV